MATDTDTDTDTRVIESFGTVNRTVGTAFRYLLVAATLFGLAVLAALLVLVANDAIQPLTADPGWHLTFLLVLVLPTAAAVAVLRARNERALTFGVTTVALLVVSLMFGGGAAMVFVDILPPVLWAGLLFAVLLPTAVVVGLERYSRQLPFLVRLAAAVAAFYVSLLGFPGPLVGTQLLPNAVGLFGVLPAAQDWVYVAGTVGVGVALVAAGYLRRLRGARAGRVAGAAALAAVLAAVPAAPLLDIDPLPAVVLASAAVVPTGLYVAGRSLTRPADRVGLLVPVVVVGGALLGAAAVEGLGFAGPRAWVDWQFLTSPHSRIAADAGLYPAIGGSILLMITVAVLAFPVGVGAAVYLEEYAPDNRYTRFIDVNISNLAGVPSVVYGLLGLGVFVTYLGRPTGTVAIGGATLALLILPIVIISSREAIRSVPSEMRQGSYGMGATRWQTVRKVVLPQALPGILTGTILSLGRAIGETAPLIMIGAPTVIFSLPAELGAKATAMPLQVFAWASLFASEEFYTRAVPAGVVVLVGVLLAMNSVAIVLRNRYQRDQ
jgi:phosphate transport system permease protein